MGTILQLPADLNTRHFLNASYTAFSTLLNYTTLQTVEASGKNRNINFSNFSISRSRTTIAISPILLQITRNALIPLTTAASGITALLAGISIHRLRLQGHRFRSRALGPA